MIKRWWKALWRLTPEECFHKTGHTPYTIVAPNLHECQRCGHVWREVTAR
jgi:hypothetical protein